MDEALLDPPGNVDIQLILKYDYQSNLRLSPEWQAYLRQYHPPTLVVWRKNDQGFLVEEDGSAIADQIRCFLATQVLENTRLFTSGK